MTNVLLPEASSFTIVLVGDFTPALFHPAWFRNKGLLPEADVADSEIGLLSQDLASLKLSWLNLFCDRNRLQLNTAGEPAIQLCDLALNLFPLISEQPVSALGINSDIHVRLPSANAYQLFGDMLAPKEPWGDYLLDVPTMKDPSRTAGLRSLVMEIPTDDPYGHIQIRVEPSLRLGPPGVFVAANHHFDFSKAEQRPDVGLAVRVLEQQWDRSMKSAIEIQQRLLSQVRQ